MLGRLQGLLRVLGQLQNARLDVQYQPRPLLLAAAFDINMVDMAKIHRASSSNKNFAVQLTQRVLTEAEIRDQRTWFGVGENNRRRGQRGQVRGQLDLVRFERIRLDFFKIASAQE